MSSVLEETVVPWQFQRDQVSSHKAVLGCRSASGIRHVSTCAVFCLPFHWPQDMYGFIGYCPPCQADLRASGFMWSNDLQKLLFAGRTHSGMRSWFALQARCMELTGDGFPAIPVSTSVVSEMRALPCLPHTVSIGAHACAVEMCGLTQAFMCSVSFGVRTNLC